MAARAVVYLEPPLRSDFPVGGSVIVKVVFLDVESRQPVLPAAPAPGLTLTSPTGAVTTPALTNDATGVYEATVTPSAPGRWSGAVVGGGAKSTFEFTAVETP